MSDKKQKQCCKKASIGGQALIEGVMMKGPKKTVIAVRHTRTKEIFIEDVNEPKNLPKPLKLPIIRGVCNFVQALITGFKTLSRSAELSGMTEIEEEEDAKKRAEEKGENAEEAQPEKLGGVFMSILMGVSTVLGVGLAIVLFMWLPSFLFGLLKDAVAESADISNLRALFEGVLKLALFIGYMAVVAQMKDIKRVFKYHGAEHKTIFCYEHNLPLTVENVRKQKRFHPRCGTSFMFLMIVVGIFMSTIIVVLFPAVATHNYIWVPVKILLVPLFCGIGYELLRFCGKHDNLLTKIIAAPGLWVQRLTTNEPDDDMIEVAIASVLPVLPEDDPILNEDNAVIPVTISIPEEKDKDEKAK